MIRHLVARELRGIFASPRFVATFGVCSLLVLLALTTGYGQFRAFADQQAALAASTAQELAEQTRWFSLRPRALRAADPLQIFSSGVHLDTGRHSVIHPNANAELRQSVYEDDAIFAVFRDLDLTFVLLVVIPLYALLLTHDAVSGERETGVLRLVLAYPVPRWQVLTAKVLGNLLGLGLPLLVPLLLGWLALLALGVPLTGQAALRLALLLAAGLGLFAFFVTFGLAVSCLTRRPAISFLAALACWITMVLVLPRLGLLVAGELVAVPSAAEIDAERAGHEREVLGRAERAQQERWQARQREVNAQPEALREAYQDDHLWAWMQEDDVLRQQAQAEIAAYSAQLDEGRRNLQARQEALALGFAGWTPAAAFRSAAVTLANTDLALGPRYRQAMEAYREEVRRFLLAQDPSAGAITIQASSSGGSVRRGDEGTVPLDLGGLPRFVPPQPAVRELVVAVLPQLALVAAATLLAFAVAAAAFARYDARA
jgi:ABC-type transport system involved in multi-copper enzyme maturation permease subunit